MAEERFLDWLAERASAYLLWHYERRVKDAPRCPDCEAPEPECYCDEQSRIQHEADGAYDAGMEHGYELAMRDGSRDLGF